MENINLEELIKAIIKKTPPEPSIYDNRGFFWLAEKCATELEKALALIKDREEHWQEVISHCVRLNILSDIRKESKSPTYQVVKGIITDLYTLGQALLKKNKELQEQVEYWQKRFKEKVFAND